MCKGINEKLKITSDNSECSVESSVNNKLNWYELLSPL